MSTKHPREHFDELLKHLGIKPEECTVAANMLAFDEQTLASYNEANARAARGLATRSDLDLINAVNQALANGRELPAAAARPLGPEKPSTTPADDLEHMVGMGIAPLIAQRISRGTEHEETIALKAARSFYSDRIAALIMIGDRGCGKTYAASWWLVHAQHFTPPPMRGRTTRRRLLNCDEVGAVKDELGECATAKALVIDDAGVEDERYHSEHIATLIARRYRNALPTIVTTNLNERDFGSRYGNRINDRLHEIGKFTTVGTSAADSLRMRMKRT